LADGKVFARCVGRMEFGARALGNRSILCDPSKWSNVRKINEKIKGRDFWMPFTPSILSHRSKDYLVNAKNLRTPFMTIAMDSSALARQHLVAAVHPYDFTIRPQIVEQDVNPEYFALIQAFESITGIGALLNTSLNLHGKPIVNTPRDALNTFTHSGLDGLILPGVLVLKRAANAKNDIAQRD
jgi:carbamoyltransferase